MSLDDLIADVPKDLDERIFGEVQSTEPPIPEGWKRLYIAAPESFYGIMMDTIERYKKARETDKVFPAIEAIFMEARNSLS